MKYKILGKSGLRVSEIALGGMTIGNDWHWGANKDESFKILSKYSDLGGNFIDTAVNYQNGSSESIIGDFIKGDRDRYVIATKYSLREGTISGDPNYGGNHRKNLLRSIKKSLERLQTDYVDILYLHIWDETVDIEHVMKILNDLVASSKVNYIAISDTPAWIISRAQSIAEQRGWYQFQAVQFPYNIESRDPERELIPMCQNLNLGMTAWRVLGAGLFTGKYTRAGYSNNGRLVLNDITKPTEEQLQLAWKLDSIAEDLEVPSSAVAIRWIMNKTGVLIPIIGATSEKQILENLNACDVKLNFDILKQLDNLTDFKKGFAYDFIQSSYAKDYIHGDTYSQIFT